MQSWLSGISWSAYFTGIGWIVGGYYAIVLGIYYRRDIARLVAGKSSRESTRMVMPATGTAVPPSKPDPVIRPGIPDTDIHRVHDLMEELKLVFRENTDMLDKAGLLACVQTLLQKYTPLIGSDFEDAVIHHIILESNEQCGIALHAEAIKAVWKERE